MADAIIIQAMSLGGDGLRVAVKDSLDIAGYPTRGGSAALADAPRAARHADVVQAVLDAGCRIIGKANMHELAYGVTGVNGWTGTPANPSYPGHVPGGSSSGSAAAVAAGLCDFALGTDTGGSIRTPAACCGVFGLKPTFGRVSRQGAHPAVSSLDCVGPFAGSVAMLERAMTIIDPTFEIAETPATIRLGRVACAADPAVAQAFDAALAGSAAHLTERTLPGMDAAFAANIAIIGAETWAAFGSLTASPNMGEDVRQRLLNASKVTADDLAKAEDVRARFRAEVDAALEGVDALVLPTMPVFVPTLEDAADAAAMLKLTALVRQFNLSGHPALSIPVATPTGLPIGIQLVGRIGGDAALCAVARALAPSLDIPTYLQREEQA
ncbi:amidase [Novosphingobium sp.]|uniref:amidase n=1 Tax=Novosphingobium sp. TaxID=1874826 RepID=UPI003529F580